MWLCSVVIIAGAGSATILAAATVDDNDAAVTGLENGKKKKYKKYNS